MDQQPSVQPAVSPAPRFRHLYLFLDNVLSTGRLGSSRPDHNPDVNIVWSLFSTIPWPFLIFEFVWSCVVVGIAYGLSDSDTTNTLTPEFWNTRLSVSKSVTHGVGWGLFALLSFFIADSAKRFFKGQKIFFEIRALLSRLVRNLCQLYPEGTWHPGDHDRIIAHIAAFPIALKMSLREECEADQLFPLLNQADAEDVVNTDMQSHCTTVIRSYFSAAEDDGVPTFQQFCTASKTPAGSAARYLIMGIIDRIDQLANETLRIATIRPAAGYVNHLIIFLYIWLMFLPLSLVSTSGWFTILWSTLICYGICMMFTIARALNQPFGFDAIDINLNMLCARSVKAILDEYVNPKIGLEQCVDKDHETPTWLEKEPPTLAYHFHEHLLSKERAKEKMKRKLKPRSLRKQITVTMIGFTFWCIFIVFLTWGVRWYSDRRLGDRWWYVYIPVDSDTTSFIGLGLFLLLGFWLSDAYNRYWDGLQSWQSQVRPGLENVALQFAIANHRGTWHERDRERIFSLVAAAPYAAKMQLRKNNNDVSGLADILSEKDLRVLLEAPNPLFHVFTILYAYLNSADSASEQVTTLKQPAYGMTSVAISEAMLAVETAFDDCVAIKEFPISPSFTLHLRLFTIFWIALLPLTLVLHDGFILFLYVLPIAYSITNLLIIGDELADPFGYDEHDIPLDQFCDEIRDSIHRLYHDTNDMNSLIHTSEYDRRDFKAKRRKSQGKDTAMDDVIAAETAAPTIFDYAKNFLNAVPRVPIVAFAAVTVWTVVAVCASYFFSRLWGDERNRGNKYGWVSWVDVDSGVLSNVGYALFLILAFRAKDGIKRYDDSANSISQIGMHLRNFAVQSVQSFKDGSYHKSDKERLIAHLVQIPLCFRDLLLGIERKNDNEKEGLLSAKDREAFEKSPSPLEHLINTVHAYAVIQDNDDKNLYLESPFKQAGPSSMMAIMRLSNVRTIIAQTIGVKRFPVVLSYKRHQHLFTLVWLVFLPLSMTSQTGWFTILWCPLIAYGVFALEEIASKLVDPLGNDFIDIPVDQLCVDVSNSILEAVNAVRWECEYHIQPSPKDMEPGIGAVLKGHVVEDKYTLNYLDQHTLSVDFDLKEATDDAKSGEQTEEQTLLVNSPHTQKIKPTLLGHFMHSVPWRAVLAITAWTTIACLFSYEVRKREFDDAEDVRWWVSFISVDSSVGTFLSIGTFALLGFYTNAAFMRYYKAGTVWGDKLRATSHTLASMFLSYTHRGALHEGDHERIVGHLAAIPLVLKSQLRDVHDLREVRGFLSHQDVGRIQCAPNMAMHCVDVLRSYMFKLMCHGATVDKKGWPGPVSVALFLRVNMEALEEMVRLSFFLKEFPISFAAMNLLNTLLAIWFIILPFVLAEKSGWFTILWTAFIAYGLVGMYSIANEIQNPFGTDLNDFDLDSMAKSIVADIVSVWKSQRNGFNSLIIERPVTDFWKNEGKHDPIFLQTTATSNPTIGGEKSTEADGDDKNPAEAKSVDGEDNDDNDNGKIDNSVSVQKNEANAGKRVHLRQSLESKHRLLQPFLLAANGIDWWMLLAVALWSTLSVVVAYLVGHEFTFQSKKDCYWFCSHIAIDESVKKYIGFALFLLLGFRLYDSHERYMSGNEIWYGDFVGLTLVPAARILQNYTPGTFHRGDIERIMGHLGVIPICLMGKFHDLVYKDELMRFLSEDDVNALIESGSPIDRCYDVLWAYLRRSEQFVKNPQAQSPIGFWEHRVVCRNIHWNKISAVKCKQIIKIPLPFGYVQHLRIFLFIWIVLLPLGLVQSSGWVTILWVTIISYGVIAIERWAHELSDPFGFDVGDVNTHAAANQILDSLKKLFLLYGRGMETLIVKDRPGLEAVHNERAEDQASD